MSQSHADIFVLVSIFKVKVTARAHKLWSKYDSFLHIIWTVDSLATKLGLIYILRSQGVLWKNLDYCIQGQGHSEGSKR